MKRILKLVMIGAAGFVVSNPALARTTEECLTHVIKDLRLADDVGFAEDVKRINAVILAAPEGSALRAERARIADAAEYVRVEMAHATCSASTPESSTMRSTCDADSCLVAPTGATMKVESCAGGVKVESAFERIASGDGKGVWKATSLNQSTVNACPRPDAG
jgi:hypothetical protein